MLASLEFALLNKVFDPSAVAGSDQTKYDTPYSKLETHFGPNWKALVQGLTVLDFGCGAGNEVIQIARAGAKSVCGFDVSQNNLCEAGRRVAASEVGDRCRLVKEAPCELFDCIFSFDAFEHFENPGAVLHEMYRLLKAGGRVYVSFGPTWFHPLGGHAFSPFPWAHLLLSESALVRWRNLHFPGTSVGINQSGLNRMTIRRFLALCTESGFGIERREIVPIRPLRMLHNRLSREWTSSVVRAVLRK